jgi:phosphoribosylamine--glycine ligase
VSVQHAGTRQDGDRLVSAGGRVLAVTAVAETLAAARERAYAGVAAVRLRGAHSRSDIALRAVRGEVTVPTRVGGGLGDLPPTRGDTVIQR